METPSASAAVAAAYFRSQRGFDRLFSLFIKKYQVLGRLAGKVTLTKPSLEEAQSLEAFFRNNCDGKPSITISFVQFAEALEQTRFSGADIIAILSSYAQAPVMTNQEGRTLADAARDKFFTRLISRYDKHLCRIWLDAVLHKAPGTRRAQAAYEWQAPENQNIFTVMLNALSNLPDRYERLPLFAVRITGNPHALDADTPAGRLFIEALKLISQEQSELLSLRSPAEEEAELLYSFHLLRDDLLSFVSCSGLTAFKAAVTGSQEIAYWREAWISGAVLNVPLRELVNLSHITPAHPQTALHSSNRKNIYIIENSGIFSTIIDYFTENALPLPPLLCTHGNFKLASWAAIDRLAAGGCTLHYSGDFDPEGLLIADRLLSRHPAQVRVWRYSVGDYFTCLEKAEKTAKITDSRLKKLDSITNMALTDIVQALRSVRRAGYQEMIVNKLIQDMLI